MNIPIIGLAGKARAGKDTIADVLVNEYGFLKLSQADKIKQTAAMMFDIQLEDFYNDDLKEVIIQKFGFSPRQMCQLIGKEGSKDLFGKNIWMQHIADVYTLMNDGMIHKLCSNMVPQWVLDIPGVDSNKKLLSEYSGMVVPSIKYQEDYDGIIVLGGSVWCVIRDNNTKVSVHVSEDGIDMNICSTIFYNNEGVEDLKENVLSYIQEEDIIL